MHLFFFSLEFESVAGEIEIIETAMKEVKIEKFDV